MTQPVFQGAIRLLKEESVERIAGSLAIIAVGTYFAAKISEYLTNFIYPAFSFFGINTFLGHGLGGALLGVFFGLIFKQAAKYVVIPVPLILLITIWVNNYNYYSSNRYGEGMENFSLINSTFSVLSDAHGWFHLFLIPYQHIESLFQI